jgi:hypothetical protein
VTFLFKRIGRRQESLAKRLVGRCRWWTGTGSTRRSYFARIQMVLASGGYATSDLGQGLPFPYPV